jgi:hypothetical protein
VGAPLHDSSTAYGAGFVYLGADLAAGGEILYGSRHALLYGDDFLGLDVTAVGDTNGDGLSEVALGSSDGYLGADSGFSLFMAIWDGADVLTGGELDTSAALATVISSSEGGEAVGGADFDGDGFADLILGNDTQGSGDVFVVPGSDLTGGAQLQNADYEAIDGSSGERLGVQNGWLEDLDGDGLPELVVAGSAGDGTDTETGVVYVISGADVFSGGAVAEHTVVWLLRESNGETTMVMVYLIWWSRISEEACLPRSHRLPMQSREPIWLREALSWPMKEWPASLRVRQMICMVGLELAGMPTATVSLIWPLGHPPITT